MSTIEEMLKEKLPREYIKQREIGGRTIDYIDGWLVIENANRIFGFDGWEFMPEHFECVNREEFENPKTNKKGYKVSYTCKGTISIISKEMGVANQVFGAIGYGSGVSYQDFGDATESAIKEADTDCLKRCMRFKGNQFGLALYDKDKRNVDDSMQDKVRAFISELPEPDQEKYKQAILTFNKSCKVEKIDSLSYEQCTELLNNLNELKNMQTPK